MCSGIATGEDKGKQPEENVWVRKVVDKDVGFNLNKEKETFMEAKRSFTDAGASTSRAQNMCMKKPEGVSTTQETDPSLVTSFLQTCMKLLRHQKAVEGLQELIDNCVRKGNPLPNQCVVHKVGKGKKRNGLEMRLTAQIGDFEMVQLILDLYGNDGFELKLGYKYSIPLHI